ncbi:pyrimidine 5'-nucleotidase [Maritalea mediterranea]|uniref:Pyrimidine 5'-nucleotidase n=1 Tax=Maritalea mediterranea TaxID=2909667 RepID=A0ABS9E7T0_9HYPH|nr:pyrimidine 5'-nucleotidase [Maritalea mediterranea]MCF4097501.1 pyrimidine 5'-nucleotidase [Maritalea mediterranea]
MPLSHVDCWIFDLDNTLYPRTCRLFDQVDKLITAYVVDVTGYEWADARKLQKEFFAEYGTTLNGLMATRNVDPHHYLERVHDIDYTPVAPNPGLMDAIRALPGRKIIFTNADRGHAQNVLKRLGGEDVFEDIFDIIQAEFEPKPHNPSYARFMDAHAVAPQNAAFFEDMEVNLKVPHSLGMRTVHVVPGADFDGSELEPFELERKDDEEHIHHVTDNLGAFLSPFARTA